MQALDEVLDEMHLYLGPNCQEFEREFAAFCNTKFAIGVGSGTEAIQFALLASGVKSGDEVITSPHTFFATAEAIAVIGATPLFADIDPVTYTINPEGLERKITGKTRAIIDIFFFTALLGQSPETAAFLPDPNGPAVSGQRALIAHKLPDISLVTSLKAISEPLWSSSSLDKKSLLLSAGSEVGREHVEQGLVSLGYRRVSTVMEKGEYCPKGCLMDIFPSTGEYPVKIEYYGDEIESLKYFDIDTQRSLRAVESVFVMPAMEPPSGCAVDSLPETTIFAIDIQKDEVPFPGKAITLSRYDFQGDGHNAGLFP